MRARSLGGLFLRSIQTLIALCLSSVANKHQLGLWPQNRDYLTSLVKVMLDFATKLRPCLVAWRGLRLLDSQACGLARHCLGSAEEETAVSELLLLIYFLALLLLLLGGESAKELLEPGRHRYRLRLCLIVRLLLHVAACGAHWWRWHH